MNNTRIPLKLSKSKRKAFTDATQQLKWHEDRLVHAGAMWTRPKSAQNMLWWWYTRTMCAHFKILRCTNKLEQWIGWEVDNEHVVIYSIKSISKLQLHVANLHVRSNWELSHVENDCESHIFLSIEGLESRLRCKCLNKWSQSRLSFSLGDHTSLPGCSIYL